MARRQRLTRIATALLIGFLLAAPVAEATDGRMIGKAGVRLKGTNIWYVQGKAVKPKTLALKVAPVPPQAVKVQWSVVCQKPNPEDPADHIGVQSKSGQTSVHGAATVQFALPYAKPPMCVATVYATLAARGILTVRLLQT